ncbi:sugar phosphorylase [Aporhodopirellula aestuarii]|uniref:Sugar phosphorylase n=1 Tax=Aporhodopirellula aestuarii TaxID=2950107 RepID=A0ABT0U8K7_9BACT|nr:sugar phosphorylase [Aporhodopirellula aestuarii]MCM2373116.1 sugar phosphorylase [Aporhodopirellula aestuarii]
MSESTAETLRHRIKDVYGHVPLSLFDGLLHLVGESSGSDGGTNRDGENADSTLTPSAAPARSTAPGKLWDHRDVVLITYADQVREPNPGDGREDAPPTPARSPLAAQHRFLVDHGLNELIRCVHLLPFCPSTSDDGFSVADYLRVDPDFGTWEDIANLGGDFDLMYDLVLNHSSQQHEWFQQFLAGDPEYADFYTTADPTIDLSEVIRPRSLPLLTSFESAEGPISVWTTFSADQVDLNYANPDVMLAMIETLVEYARRGARIVRLDAIAFLWKEIGSSCLHLPQTHAAVKLMRWVLDHAVPGTLILTETNVPHRENVSYFGSGDDEAHMVYQFSLPPLLLDAIHSGDTSVLTEWMGSLTLPSDETTYFNFTASHDGIGVRPAEGLLPPERIDALVKIVRDAGGKVGMRAQSDGSESPYELNITYLDAVADRRQVSPAEHSRRFLATQAVMLSMRGIPAIYFHSLVGSPCDFAAVESSGINRRINRHKYDRSELESALLGPDSLQRQVMDGYRQLLDVRRSQTAFDPAATQTMLDLPTDGLIGWVRQIPGEAPLIVVANLSGQPRSIDPALLPSGYRLDVLAEEDLDPSKPLDVRPFQVRWMV